MEQEIPKKHEKEGAEMVITIAKCALAVGTCLYQGAKAVLALRDAGAALHRSVKEQGPSILKIVKRGSE